MRAARIVELGSHECEQIAARKNRWKALKTTKMSCLNLLFYELSWFIQFALNLGPLIWLAIKKKGYYETSFPPPPPTTSSSSLPPQLTSTSFLCWKHET